MKSTFIDFDKMRPIDVDRFWDKVDVSETGCWEWLGGGNIVPVFWYNGKNIIGYRFAYFLYNGHYNQDLLACHTCDNQLCVRQDHLFLGTNADNSRDMVLKGRRKGDLPGENHSKAKLTQVQAEEIRIKYGRHSPGGKGRHRTDITMQQLSEEYGISLMQIQSVIKRRSYK